MKLNVAPEICIEVLSNSNTDDEMQEKRQLYFEQQAKEVWICSQTGKIIFYNSQEQIDNSILMPEFPHQIKI